MAENSGQTQGGVGFVGLLTIAFVVLKLCHVIDWRWWWVLSPLWITALVVIIILGIALLALIISYAIKKRRQTP